MEKMAMRSVAFELTKRCNQRCSYCYNGWRGKQSAQVPAAEISAEQLAWCLDRVLAEVPIRSVTFTGGEPLLRDDLEQLLEVVAARGLRVAIITNGTLAEKALPRLRVRLPGLPSTVSPHAGKLCVQVLQLTLAGADAPTHDAVCGAGSFHRVLRAIELLRAEGFGVGGSFLCTAESATQAAAVLRRFASLGVKRMAFNRFNPSGFGQEAMQALLPSRSQVIEALGAVDALVEELGMRVSNTMPIPACMLDTKAFRQIRFGHCSAGTQRGEVALSANGDVRLCTVQRRVVGNLHQSSLLDLLDSAACRAFRTAIPSFCRDCSQAASCLGGCGAAAEWVSGHFDALDPFLAQHLGPDESL